ncbi:hypothetical protein B7H01_19855 [Pandoraea apista]|nr:hypothetical protein B7H01_19855 [Pandoraea apista]
MGNILDRMHEWAAERFSFVQYPKIHPAQPRPSPRASAVMQLKWLIFAALMWWLWAPVLLALLVVALMLW